MFLVLALQIKPATATSFTVQIRCGWCYMSPEREKVEEMLQPGKISVRMVMYVCIYVYYTVYGAKVNRAALDFNVDIIFHDCLNSKLIFVF